MTATTTCDLGEIHLLTTTLLEEADTKLDLETLEELPLGTESVSIRPFHSPSCLHVLSITDFIRSNLQLTTFLRRFQNPYNRNRVLFSKPSDQERIGDASLTIQMTFQFIPTNQFNRTLTILREIEHQQIACFYLKDIYNIMYTLLWNIPLLESLQESILHDHENGKHEEEQGEEGLDHIITQLQYDIRKTLQHLEYTLFDNEDPRPLYPEIRDKAVERSFHEQLKVFIDILVTFSTSCLEFQYKETILQILDLMLHLIEDYLCVSPIPSSSTIPPPPPPPLLQVATTLQVAIDGQLAYLISCL